MTKTAFAVALWSMSLLALAQRLPPIWRRGGASASHSIRRPRSAARGRVASSPRAPARPAPRRRCGGSRDRRGPDSTSARRRRPCATKRRRREATPAGCRAGDARSGPGAAGQGSRRRRPPSPSRRRRRRRSHRSVGHSLGHRRRRMQSVVLRLQLVVRFDAVWIDRNARHRAHLHALRLVEVADAFGASLGGRSRRSRGPMLIASFGHSGSQTSQLMHSSVISRAMRFSLAFGRDDRRAFDRVGFDGRTVLRHAFLQAPQHRGCHELGDITAQAGNLAHEGAADELVLVRRRHEHGLDIGHQVPVHSGHLELVLEVAHRAQPAHDDLAAELDDEVAQQPAERRDLDVRVGRCDFGRRSRAARRS